MMSFLCSTIRESPFRYCERMQSRRPSIVWRSFFFNRRESMSDLCSPVGNKPPNKKSNYRDTWKWRKWSFTWLRTSPPLLTFCVLITILSYPVSFFSFMFSRPFYVLFHFRVRHPRMGGSILIRKVFALCITSVFLGGWNLTGGERTSDWVTLITFRLVRKWTFSVSDAKKNEDHVPSSRIEHVLWFVSWKSPYFSFVPTLFSDILDMFSHLSYGKVTKNNNLFVSDPHFPYLLKVHTYRTLVLGLLVTR